MYIYERNSILFLILPSLNSFTKPVFSQGFFDWDRFRFSWIFHSNWSWKIQDVENTEKWIPKTPVFNFYSFMNNFCFQARFWFWKFLVSVSRYFPRENPRKIQVVKEKAMNLLKSGFQFYSTNNFSIFQKSRFLNSEAWFFQSPDSDRFSKSGYFPGWLLLIFFSLLFLCFHSWFLRPDFQWTTIPVSILMFLFSIFWLFFWTAFFCLQCSVLKRKVCIF